LISVGAARGCEKTFSVRTGTGTVLEESPFRGRAPHHGALGWLRQWSPEPAFTPTAWKTFSRCSSAAFIERSQRFEAPPWKLPVRTWIPQNARRVDDGERVSRAIKSMDGKRLTYRAAVDSSPWVPGRWTGHFNRCSVPGNRR